jgi:endonuclease III-like uncharacterized protein
MDIYSSNRIKGILKLQVATLKSILHSLTFYNVKESTLIQVELLVETIQF